MTKDRVVVVGSGIAGLIAALELHERHRVVLITKSELCESNTRYAQGGIAAAMADEDTIGSHVSDTLRAGAGLNDERAVAILCAEGPARIRDLIRLGVAFDQRDGELARGMEAAHSHARVLHAGGDATGYAIELALIRAVRAAGIEVLEHTFAMDLLVEAGRTVGIRYLDAVGGVKELRADAVILASGGAGQLFPYTTNPAVATGDGIAMGLRAGAEVADLEFYQFHPTSLAAAGNFLISEAVRGDGAVLRNEAGERFMCGVHEAAELAPRDAVSRGIAAEMQRQGGRPVLLDATGLGREFLAERFPTIDAACRGQGLDWGGVPLPVTPAAHYWMGGVRTDAWGRTSLPGLYAVGEAACTGAHGANRLASNSLLESLVFAWRCAALLSGRAGTGTEGEATALGTEADTSTLLSVPLDEDRGAVLVDRERLQRVMWDRVGIFRDGEGLAEAAAELGGMRGGSGSVRALEDANLLVLARAMAAAATARRESRGAHFRTDHPVTSPAFGRQIRVAREVPVLC